ncbi:30119_t:CDS:1, partial [Racocetra persica]
LNKDSINLETEDADIDLYFEKEFNKEFLQINVEAVNIETNNELAMSHFFNLRLFEQNQKDVVEDSSTINSQRPTNNINIDWLVDDIFF